MNSIGADSGIEKVWPDWQVEKILGNGSYGTVYQAVRRDSNLVTRSAIKVISIPSTPAEISSLRSEGLGEEGTRTYLKGIVDNFIDEIRLMETLKATPNIVSVEDYKVIEKKDEIGWTIYIRMELLTPFNVYKEKNYLGEKDIIKLGCDICSALEICDSRNIIHRDIKPENIFISDFGYYKLGDFGIARELENVSGSLSQKGTFNYMAPEVANTGRYDKRVDIYSLGVVLYRLLNKNMPPFISTEKQMLNPNERRYALERRLKGTQIPPPADASPAMADVILRACSYDPNQRYASASEMKRALENLSDGTYRQAENSDVPDYGDKTVAARKPVYSGNVPEAVESPVITRQDNVKKKKKGFFVPLLLILAVVIGFFVNSLLNGVEYAEKEESGEYLDASDINEPLGIEEDGIASDTEQTDVSNSNTETDSINTDSDKTDIPPVISYEINDIVTFGTYEQDNNYSNGQEPIQWIVLDKQDGRYLLLSKYALDCQSYDTTDANGVWQNSSLRYWLKDVFFTTAFSENEQNKISYHNGTLSDKVFCLSVRELEQYYPDTSDRITSATPYAVTRGAYQENGVCGWWLRSQGDSSDYAARVNIKGDILSGSSSEGGTQRTDYSVRPAIWVELG
ncbi:MAG: serine/threonine protein kinase [Clostridia bacterium]|nr:serine/threonine protein kinase [Clostridia bacterium]